MKKSLQDALIVDLDGATCLLSQGRADILEEISSVPGNKWVLTDFGGASSRYMTVEAPARYAEIVVHKKLQEMGDAGEYTRICTHWKRARGKTSTEIFFTPVEGRLYSAYEDRAYDDANHHLVFSIHALLYACLREHSRNQTVLVMFEHDRHVDLLLGRSGHVLASSRVSSYANMQDAKENQIDTVAQELRTMLVDIQGPLERIVYCNWLMGADAPSETQPMAKESTRLMAAEWAVPLAREFNAQFKPLPSQRYAIHGHAFVVTSILDAVQYLGVEESSSPVLDRWRYLAQRILPVAALGAVLMVAGLYMGGLWLQWHSALLLEETRKLTETTEAMRVNPLDPAYQKVVAFADHLAHLKRAPTLQGILSEISDALNGRIVFDQVIIEYDHDIKIKTTLKGRIKTDFFQASQHYEAFVSSLTSRHFRVVHSELSADIAELQFTLKLEREPVL
ncbi:MAG: hypothetical protein H7839_09255 [Magnetococcus sp. YQC-5]